MTLVWSRRVRSWRDALRTEAPIKALREEHRIKTLRRRDKEALVAGGRRSVA